MAINNPVIADADIIQDTAVAIQEKDHGGKMEAPDIPSRIRALNVTDKWELLNVITLGEDVSVIKIDISSFKNVYSAFLVAPYLTPSGSENWFYVGWENENGLFLKGAYDRKPLSSGFFEFPNYMAYCSKDMSFVTPSNFGGGVSTPFNYSIVKYIVISLYNTSYVFLSGGKCKLYGKKKEDYLNVNQ